MAYEKKNIDSLLFKTYYDPKCPAAFSSCDRLYKYIRTNHTNKHIKKSEIAEWLGRQRTFTLHRDRRTRFKRNHYNITNIDDLWEMDLIDMQQFSRQNNGYKYVLAVIDCFSKYAWCVPIKRKTPAEVINGFNIIFSKTQRRCIRLQSDKGREFWNKSVRAYFSQENIEFFTTRDPAIKACICERFIRSIKGIIYKYFTFANSKRYVDLLDSFTCLYNNRFHSSIGVAPNDVNEKNVLAVWQYMQRKRTKSRSHTKLRIGDIVRVSNPKAVFEKGYKPRWSDEKFTIDKVLLRSPVVFNIRDTRGELIKGNFYASEIQKID